MPIKENITIKEVVAFLNEILEIDNYAMTAFVSMRFTCNKALADHPSVQVGLYNDRYFEVGLIGILNGIFGKDEYGWGHISAVYKDGKIEKFNLLTDKQIKNFKEKGFV
jgi:hypothetical protein